MWRARTASGDIIYWLGRSANAEVFGKAFDAWYSAMSDADSVPAKLMARFDECGNGNDTRHAYMTFP